MGRIIKQIGIIGMRATINKTKKLMGVGVIIRDSMGKIFASMCMSLPYIIDPTMAEAYAVWKTIF
jgi:hypothetical protein